MLFAVASWIIALTVIGILAICVFRALCESPRREYGKYGEKSQPSPETKIEASAVEAKKESGSSVEKTALVNIENAETSAPEEEKPLNTQQNPDAPQEARASNAADPASNAPAEKSAINETQNNVQVPAVSAGNALSASNGTEISSQPPTAKVSNVPENAVAAVSEPVVEQKGGQESPQDSAPLTDVVIQKQQNNNEIPTLHNEVAKAVLLAVKKQVEVSASMLSA